MNKQSLFKKAFMFILLLSSVSFVAGINNSENALHEGSEISSSGIPSSRTCGTVEFNKQMALRFPQFNENRKALEEFTKNFENDNVLITIPVVVHVLYNTPEQNISDAQIMTQLEVMNQDFSRQNADSGNTPGPFKAFGANTQIQFCMAQRDPAGQPTNGITRTSTTVVEFQPQDPRIYSTAQGGMDIWDRDKYCNIYVCNLGGGLLGFAQFPGGDPATDANVIGYKYFGTIGTAQPPYDKGRTTTHEVGHWLNLFHIWGDEPDCAQDDEVADTPLQGNSSAGCPTFPMTDACSGVAPGIMFMNYMDYSDDACMNLFTLGQSVRMNAAILGARASLITSNGCQPVSVTPIGSEIPDGFKLYDNYPNPFNPSTNFKFGIPSSSFVKLEVFDMTGRKVASLLSETLQAGVYQYTFNAEGLNSGTYFFRLEAGSFVETKKMLLVK